MVGTGRSRYEWAIRSLAFAVSGDFVDSRGGVVEMEAWLSRVVGRVGITMA